MIMEDILPRTRTNQEGRIFTTNHTNQHEREKEIHL